MTITARALIAAIENDLDFAYRIEQTGGGTATIYVGGDDQVAIGPGNYDWNDPYASEFYFSDLYVGLSDDDGVYEQVHNTIELLGAVEHFIQLSNNPVTK